MNKDDVVLHKGLMKLLDEATFSLQAREVKAFLVIYEWAKNMPSTMIRKPQKKEKDANKR